ncbi:MAG: hypothetical protein HY683_09960 [Chloroflexi bacterium]|nr:hypothetical protein [Chloroflexota bacterium]
MVAKIAFSKDEIQVIYIALKPAVHGVDLVWRFAGPFHDVFVAKNPPRTTDIELEHADLWAVQDAVPVAAGTKSQPDAGLQIHLKIIGALMELKAASEVEEVQGLLQEVGHDDPGKGHHKARRKASHRTVA